MRLNGRVAIVTGATGGIGRLVARRFATEGARLCLTDRYGCLGLAEELTASGHELIDIPTDVTNNDDIRTMVQRTLEAFCKVDILVTVAGIASTGDAETLSEAAWDRVMAVNLKGVFLCCQAVIPAMRAPRYGRIVTIGSVLAKNGGNPRPWIDRNEQARSGNAAYGAAKAGVHAMTLYLAKELAADNITVNRVAPGPVGPRLRRGMLGDDDQLPDTFKALLPVGRLGRPEEVADAVTYLAGEQASFTTGEILDVNGGGWVD